MIESKEFREATRMLNDARERCLEILKKEFPVGSKWGVNRMCGQKNPTPGIVRGYTWSYSFPVVIFEPVNPPKKNRWGSVGRKAGGLFKSSPENIEPLT